MSMIFIASNERLTLQPKQRLLIYKKQKQNYYIVVRLIIMS